MQQKSDSPLNHFVTSACIIFEIQQFIKHFSGKNKVPQHAHWFIAKTLIQGEITLNLDVCYSDDYV